MKKILTSIICFGILLGLYIPCVYADTNTRTYYVDCTAPEGGNGTSRNPFKSLSDAVAAVHEYVTSSSLRHNKIIVSIAEGIYAFDKTEVFTAEFSSSSDCTVVFAADGDVIFSGSYGLSILSGSLISIEGAENLSFEGITFSNNLNAPLVSVSGKNITFDSCTFMNSSVTNTTPDSSLLYALSTDGYNITVTECEFYNVTGGVSLRGGDRATLTNISSTVSNCSFRDYNISNKHKAAAISIDGVGNIVKNNEIVADGSAGIIFCGNSHNVEYNRISSASVGIEGYGGIAHYGSSVRYNYISSPLSIGINISNGVSGVKVYGNVIRGGVVGVNLRGGRSLCVENNVFVYDAKSGSSSSSAIVYDGSVRDEVLYNNGLIAYSRELTLFKHNTGIWSQVYPELAAAVVPAAITESDDPDMFFNPAGSAIRNNAIYISGNVKKVNIQFAGDMVDGIPYQQRYGIFFNNVTMPRGDLSDLPYLAIDDPTLKSGASVYKALKDFQEIPFAMIGRQISFNDVSTDNWAYPWIKFAYFNGIMSGTSSDGTVFSPNGTTSRSMMVQILYNLEGRPSVEFKNIFSDVNESDWYASAVMWAYSNGITSGTSDSTFSPDSPVTREQIAVMLYRYLRDYKRITPSVGVSPDTFADAEEISPYADFREALSWALGDGILTGKSTPYGLRLAPGDTAVRSEAAAMLARFYIANKK